MVSIVSPRFITFILLLFFCHVFYFWSFASNLVSLLVFFCLPTPLQLLFFFSLLFRHPLFYSANTRAGTVRTKLINHNVNWKQRMSTFFVNGPMTFKNANNRFTEKFENSTTLQKVADLWGISPCFWLLVSILIFKSSLIEFVIQDVYAKSLRIKPQTVNFLFTARSFFFRSLPWNRTEHNFLTKLRLLVYFFKGT